MQIQAVYESGVLRPLDPIVLREGEVVEVILLPRNSKEDATGQRFEQEWIAVLKQQPDEAGRAEDWLEAQAWAKPKTNLKQG
ncbi:MAG: antitoxin family protein [Blastocatellia bacterium]